MSAGPVDARPVLLFDVDGTVVDSAPGMVRSLQAAMAAVGLEPAAEGQLRADLGPPPAVMLAGVGVPESLINDAVIAYRAHYRQVGMDRAEAFAGVPEALGGLCAGYRLATATMKLIDTATEFLARHGLRDHFEVVGGARNGVFDKAAIIAETRVALGSPAAENMIMIGDRHSDISGGHSNGLRTIAVSWGYGSRAELEASEPDVIIDRPDQLAEAATRLLQSATA
ncbi:phosphoglycolate phosphatase [Microlunatus endophyticus]|uniref:Phosphoglycolate phosphatase n=1 Tax=Microlunatus endophyticus TaxID=1716077 RepID=A0A917S4J7_9ACTN|nr:HAD hydrolase-like protein [Microlunatus endophyticus]GGL56581.1 phosphoglycolate phosphatase [Microlunatus endophyticus]